MLKQFKIPYIRKSCHRLTNQNLWKFGTVLDTKIELSTPTVSIDQTQLFIGGKFVDSISGKTMPTIDPRNEQVITQVAEADKEDIDIAVSAARESFENGAWSATSGSERTKTMNKLADLVIENAETLAQLETWDVGKPIMEASFDMLLVEDLIRYFAGYTDKFHGKTIPCNDLGGAKKFAYTLHEPIGVVGCITPWNFPLATMSSMVIPALAMGNSLVIKVAESTPLTALYFAKLCAEAGIPDGVINIVPGFGPTAGASLARHSGIDKIAFTGETITGKEIMKSASENITPVTLELGGKSPCIIFDDSDIDLAVGTLYMMLYFNSGQCCCSPTRLYVHENIYDEFIEKMLKLVSTRVVGDPFNSEISQGPSQNKQQFEKVLKYIELGKKQGATLLNGGNRIGNQGYFIEPTIFGDVKDNMDISRKEIFGPVMQIAKFKDAEEVIKRANDTDYGLAAGVFSSNVNTINRVSRSLKAGTVWINTFMTLEAGVPFGGYKNSGFGRVFGEDALHSFTQVKSVVQSLPNDGGWY